MTTTATLSATTGFPANSAMANLFARYLSGEIAETTWQKLMGLLDSDRVSLPQRNALIAFLSETFLQQKKA